MKIKISFFAYACFSLIAFSCSPSKPLVKLKPIPDGALKDCQFVAAKNFATQYCSDCHTSTGASKHKAKALQNITMDTYHDWIQAAKAVPGVLDKAHLESKLMPPPKYPHQPTDAERQVIIDWVLRGSPNTESGK